VVRSAGPKSFGAYMFCPTLFCPTLFVYPLVHLSLIVTIDLPLFSL